MHDKIKITFLIYITKSWCINTLAASGNLLGPERIFKGFARITKKSVFAGNELPRQQQPQQQQ
jgi:hypothetical protein